MASLSIDNVCKTYNNGTDVLKGIDIAIDDGQFLILVGPSGCGKSTLLNMIAGLDDISSGDIRIGERRVNDLSPKDRDIAMVFQSYALYPSMSVRQNISFGLEIRKQPKAEIDATVNRVAEMLQITHLLDRKPSQLSGGQRQRVAMGRALARNPSIFLFDEPLSNLDAKLRVEMRTEIKLMHQRLKSTIVYVTHDQIEAMTLGDRIAVMKDGIVQQFGSPQDIYDNPANLFVAGFIGSPSMNFIPATVVESGGQLGVKVCDDHGCVVLPLPHDKAKLAQWVGKDVIFGIRPEQITDARTAHREGLPQMDCHVKVIEPTGPDTLIFVTLNDTKVCCRAHPTEAKRPGDAMQLVFDVSKAVLFDPKTEMRIA
ncbi:ABC transporter ATP-binding protein [Pseudogulbenkiania subflava]|uniref:Multiple sugar transport system ATP-binding protein n=1 Tax=Pseudogulbenkiania subflava DSM 22618 TaxID=1123014 RepID=A0A1Y6B604_9NEIS|nr:sn-glycerol-3-phosphate ABC transporter ATP-binding protein UgpC [Pseudogulbenkiania subflava]SME94001.1 multiple sugar transport system ATP-binding protein [Pseudogulbenkiania subflava DSM 22618]